MKRFIAFLVAGVMMILGTACSSDDEPDNGSANREIKDVIESINDLDGKIDEALLSDLVAGNRNGVLKRDTVVNYDMPTGSDHWCLVKEGLDIGFWLGRIPDSNRTIVFQDGVVYIRMRFSLFSQSAYEFLLILSAYEEVTHKNFNLYEPGNIDIDYLMRRMNINATEMYIHSFGNEGFVISHTSEYWGGLNGNGGHSLEVSYYNLTDETLDIGGRDLVFNSEKECFQFILDICRERFGEEVDVNKIFTDRILDIHIYNFDELAEKYGLE